MYGENDTLHEDTRGPLNETNEREDVLRSSPSKIREGSTSQRVGTIASRSIGSLHSNPRLQTNGSVRLKTVTSLDEAQQKEAFGFVHGDFSSGKILDLSIPYGCFLMAFSPDLLAVGLKSGGVALYETQAFSRIHTLERKNVVSAIQWLSTTNDDSLLLAIGGLDGLSTLYKLDLDLLEHQGGATVLEEFSVGAQIRAMTLSMLDEDKVLWMVGDKSGTVTVRCFYPHHPSMADKAEYSYDGGILGLDVNASGTLAAISTKSGEVSVRSIHKEDGISLGGDVYTTHRRGPIRSVVFTGNEKRLVFGGYDKTVVVVDTSLWAITRELKVQGTINTLAFDPLERYLAVGARDKSFVLYDTSSWCPLKTIHTPGWVTSISWGGANDPRDLVAVRTEPNCISLLDLTPIQTTDMHMSSSNDPECSLSWTRDGYYVARTVGNKVVIADARQQFVDVASCDTGGYVRCVAFCTVADKSDLLAVVNTAGYLFVLKLTFAESECSLEIVHSSFIEEHLWVVAWSSDGKLLVTGGKGKELHILSASNFKKKRDPMKLAGRVWDVDFLPQGLVSSLGERAALAVGTGDYVATLYDGNSYQATLQIMRERTVRCIKYHPSRPLLAIGDGSNLVAIIDYVEEELVFEFSFGGRVNCLDFSPRGDFLVVGSDDCRCTIHETVSYKAVQEIRSSGFAMAAAFSPSGEYLTLGCVTGDYCVVRMGPLLATDLLPLGPTLELDGLPSWALNEALYRSGDGPSLVQRFMLEGSPETLRLAAHVLQHHPDAMYTFDRTTGEGCFDTALSLQKPNLLKLTLTTVVDGTLEKETMGGGKRSILTTDLPERGSEALYDMIFNLPPQFIVDILDAMTFIKVPFSQPHPFSAKDRHEMASRSYTDPWQGKLSMLGNEKTVVDDIPMKMAGAMYRTPAVLPLPGLGTMKFLSALIEKTPPSVFDNDAMGLVLRVMWRDHVRSFFLADVFLFIAFCVLWVVYVDLTASTTASSTGITAEGAVGLALLVINSGFAIKETIRSDMFRRLPYFKSKWNLIDLISIMLVYAYVISTVTRGGAGSGLVQLVVVATLFLTLKLMAYLRGFGDTGWLISVLRNNVFDMRGFAIVLGCCLFGFALAFRVLYGDIPGECLYDGTEVDCDPDPFGSYGRSLLSTFELAVLGVYDPNILSDSQFGILSALCFVLAVMSVVVVMLNALIALLGDSYARVQENATANRRRERAELIFEYLCILTRKRRRSIEKKTKYFHALLESDEDGDLLVNQNDWQGGLSALRRDLQEDQALNNEANQRALETLRVELNGNIASLHKEMTSMLNDISEELLEIKKRQAQGAFSGKNIAKAVKVVKSIGKKEATGTNDNSKT